MSIFSKVWGGMKSAAKAVGKGISSGAKAVQRVGDKFGQWVKDNKGAIVTGVTAVGAVAGTVATLGVAGPALAGVVGTVAAGAGVVSMTVKAATSDSLGEAAGHVVGGVAHLANDPNTVKAAEAVGVSGFTDFLDDLNAGLDQVSKTATAVQKVAGGVKGAVSAVKGVSTGSGGGSGGDIAQLQQGFVEEAPEVVGEVPRGASKWLWAAVAAALILRK